MNDDQFDDLKQFIAVTVSQATTDLATKADLKLLEQRLDDGFAGVGEALETIHEHSSITDERVTKLEQKLAA